MGHTQSREETEKVQISSRFSTTELTKLENLCFSSQNSDESLKWNYASIKARITTCFDESIATQLIQYLNKRSIAQEEQQIVSNSFLHFVFYLTKDSIPDLARIIFETVGSKDEVVSKASMQLFLTQFVACLHKGCSSDKITFENSKTSCNQLVKTLTKDFPENFEESEFELLLHRTPLLVDILQYKFRLTFFEHVNEGSKEVQDTMPCLIPELVTNSKSPDTSTFLLTLPEAVFFNSQLPVSQQRKWRLLYCSRVHGESVSIMTGAMIDQGPTLIIIRDSDGFLFGGYASDSWKFSSQFQGTDSSFLFTIIPNLAAYHCTGAGYNDHYMYLNIGQETMPNGLGMGGQHNFFGLWLDQEFGSGHSKAKPACTTFGSPQLSKEEEFKVDSITVWGVGEPKKKTGEEDTEEVSVLDRHVEAKALLEIAGKSRVSEGLRDLEPDTPETKQLQVPHDPMT